MMHATNLVMRQLHQMIATTAPVLVPGLLLFCALIAYHELCSWAFGHPFSGLRVAAPWALQIAVGWVLAGALLAIVGPRAIETSFARERPPIAFSATVCFITVFTLVCEVVLVQASDRPRSALLPFLYQRAPVNAGASLIVVGLFISRRLLKRATTRQDRSGPREGEESMRVMTGTGSTEIHIADIECLQAQGNYLSVRHSSGRTYLLRQTISTMQSTLDPAKFVRIHRSTIVNRHLVSELRRGGVVILKSGHSVKIARGSRDLFMTP